MLMVACILVFGITATAHAKTLTVKTADKWYGLPFKNSAWMDRQITVYGQSGYWRQSPKLRAGCQATWCDAPDGNYRIRVIWFGNGLDKIGRENNYYGNPFAHWWGHSSTASVTVKYP